MFFYPQICLIYKAWMFLTRTNIFVFQDLHSSIQLGSSRLEDTIKYRLEDLVSRREKLEKKVSEVKPHYLQVVSLLSYKFRRRFYLNLGN